ncbi:hypothetical protein [Falsiroseomonas sp. HW251]|uniref:hypothetical protein n=1 Tax=Falsiroseomonas sp. HW251 TaxID=3390998 RepID=UPI003D3222AC
MTGTTGLGSGTTGRSSSTASPPPGSTDGAGLNRPDMSTLGSGATAGQPGALGGGSAGPQPGQPGTSPGQTGQPDTRRAQTEEQLRSSGAAPSPQQDTQQMRDLNAITRQLAPGTTSVPAPEADRTPTR